MKNKKITLLGLSLAALLASCASPTESSPPVTQAKASFDNVYSDKTYTYGTWAEITGGKTPQFAIGDYSESVTVEGTTEGTLKATVGTAAATMGWSAGTLAQVSDPAKAKGSYFDFTSVAAIQFKVRGTLPLENVKVKLEEADGGVPVADVPVSTYGVTALSALDWAQGSIDTTGFTDKEFKVAFAFVLGVTPGYVEFKDIAFVDSTGANVNIAQTISYTTTVTSFSALKAAISSATTKSAGLTVGSATGNVPQEAKTTFDAAIVAAQAVADTETATQAEVDAAVAALNSASAAVTAAIIGAVRIDPAYLYKTVAGAVDITSTSSNWGTGDNDLVYALDADYNPVIRAIDSVGNAWGGSTPTAATAFESIEAGTFTNYATLQFKIKTTRTTMMVKMENAAGASNEVSVTLTDGTAIGSNGWVQMSIPISSFGVASTATKLGFHTGWSGGGGTFYLTDVCLAGQP